MNFKEFVKFSAREIKLTLRIEFSQKTNSDHQNKKNSPKISTILLQTIKHPSYSQNFFRQHNCLHCTRDSVVEHKNFLTRIIPKVFPEVTQWHPRVSSRNKVKKYTTNYYHEMLLSQRLNHSHDTIQWETLKFHITKYSQIAFLLLIKHPTDTKASQIVYRWKLIKIVY